LLWFCITLLHDWQINAHYVVIQSDVKPIAIITADNPLIFYSISFKRWSVHCITGALCDWPKQKPSISFYNNRVTNLLLHILWIIITLIMTIELLNLNYGSHKADCTLTLATLGKWATTHKSVFSCARTALGLCCLDRPDFKRW